MKNLTLFIALITALSSCTISKHSLHSTIKKDSTTTQVTHTTTTTTEKVDTAIVIPSDTTHFTFTPQTKIASSDSLVTPTQKIMVTHSATGQLSITSIDRPKPIHVLIDKQETKATATKATTHIAIKEKVTDKTVTTTYSIWKIGSWLILAIIIIFSVYILAKRFKFI